MRNWDLIDQYYEELLADTYGQPEDAGHTDMAEDVIVKWMPKISDAKSVLDVGCGTGFCSQFFIQYKMEYTGIAVGVSSETPKILDLDYNFSMLPFESYDLIFSRHSLEHSPFALFTLMEWHRIAKKYLILVLPNPDYYTFIGRNHYSVMERQQVKWLLRRAGWKLLDKDYTEYTELRFLCEKMPRVGPEGYVQRLTEEVYEKDRDD